MSTTNQASKNLTEQDIDQIVVAQAEDDSAWDDPIALRKTHCELTAEGRFVDTPYRVLYNAFILRWSDA
jgi:hypothetical protein